MPLKVAKKIIARPSGKHFKLLYTPVVILAINLAIFNAIWLELTEHICTANVKDAYLSLRIIAFSDRPKV